MTLVKYKTSAKGFKEMAMDFIHNSASESVYHNSSSGSFLTLYFSHYLRNVFVCFFPLLLDLPLNANNPNCTCLSCLHDHKGKENTHNQVKHGQLVSKDKEGQKQTKEIQEGTLCGQQLL